jgi:hypothetical protein
MIGRRYIRDQSVGLVDPPINRAIDRLARGVIAVPRSEIMIAKTRRLTGADDCVGNHGVGRSKGDEGMVCQCALSRGTVTLQIAISH